MEQPRKKTSEHATRSVQGKRKKSTYRGREGRTSSSTTTMAIVDVAHGIVEFVEEAVEPTKKNMNINEQSR
jgi:hypothetical protein